MSREIKFRAWDKQNECWFEPTYQANEGNLEELSISVPDGRLQLRTIKGTADESTFPDRFELAQYTGLKDKNGVEIYEGDIVTFDFTRQDYIGSAEDELVGQGVVTWSENNAAFTIPFAEEGYEHSLNTFDGQEFEVIGNIYEGIDPS